MVFEGCERNSATLYPINQSGHTFNFSARTATTSILKNRSPSSQRFNAWLGNATRCEKASKVMPDCSRYSFNPPEKFEIRFMNNLPLENNTTRNHQTQYFYKNTWTKSLNGCSMVALLYVKVQSKGKAIYAK